MTIIDAIAARDPMKAAEAMRQHLLMLQESLIRVTSLDAQPLQRELAETLD
jgi:DNA-binding GntR family transcriptional regulator